MGFLGTLRRWVQGLLARLGGAVGLAQALGRPRHGGWLFAALLGAVVPLLLPLPGLLVDGLFVLNLLMAVALCLRAAVATSPLGLPELPVLLIASVLLRLGTNVAALRLILDRGDAGWLLGGGSWLLGDVVVGGVLIAVMGAVEYLVLARGGERVAEVAARFVLDALPGRQAAIEADLRGGLIDAAQAQERRAALDREAQIYGALDGALRLLKGDVVAALLLLVAGLGGGLLGGVLRQGLELGEAAERYGLLALTQGLLSQVPVILNTAAAALLLSRGGQAEPPAVAVPADSQAITVEAGLALGLDEAALGRVREAASARLGFIVPPLLTRPATTGRRLAVRLFGAPLHGGELAADAAGRTVLLDVLLRAAPDLLTLDTVQAALDELGRGQPALLRETVPRRIDLGRLTALLRRLLGQRVWPLDVRAVLETVATLPKLDPDIDVATEQVRASLGRFLIQGFLRTGDGESAGGEGLPALLLASEIEELLRDAHGGRPTPFVDPELGRDIVHGVQSAKRLAPEAVLLCHADVRRQVEGLLQSAPETLPVLAYSEVPASVPVVVMGRVEPGGGADGSVPFVDSAAVPWQMRTGAGTPLGAGFPSAASPLPPSPRGRNGL